MNTFWNDPYTDEGCSDLSEMVQRVRDSWPQRKANGQGAVRLYECRARRPSDMSAAEWADHLWDSLANDVCCDERYSWDGGEAVMRQYRPDDRRPLVWWLLWLACWVIARRHIEWGDSIGVETGRCADVTLDSVTEPFADPDTD